MRNSQKRSGKKLNRPQVQRRQPNVQPGGTNFQPVNEKVVEQMYMQMAPQKDGTSLYAPGAPIRPIPGITPHRGRVNSPMMLAIISVNSHEGRKITALPIYATLPNSLTAYSSASKCGLTT